MDTRKRNAFRLSLVAGAVAALGWSAGSFAQEGYVISGTGDVVVSGRGDCVYTGRWTPSDAIAQCDPDLVAVQAPVVEERVVQAPRQIRLDADTTFAFDKAELTDEGKRLLDQIADAATSEQTRNEQITIVGYTDKIGTEEYNLDLSERRAQAVREYLVERGVSEQNIQTAARGESNPIVSCEGLTGDEAIQCLRPNRRTEIEFAALEVAPGQEEQLQPEQLPPEQQR